MQRIIINGQVFEVPDGQGFGFNAGPGFGFNAGPGFGQSQSSGQYINNGGYAYPSGDTAVRIDTPPGFDAAYRFPEGSGTGAEGSRAGSFYLPRFYRSPKRIIDLPYSIS